MREILFKAKRKDNGEWIEGFYSYYRPLDKHYIKKCTDLAYEIEIKTLSQYTGLKDSNGNKVWENDIIRFADKTDFNCYIESLENPEDYEGCDYSSIFEVDKVVYGPEYSYPAFDLYNYHFDCNGLSGLIGDDWHFEVIGNIFDTPELIGGWKE